MWPVATESEPPRPTLPSKDLVSMISLPSSLLSPQALAYERRTPVDAHSDAKPCQSQNKRTSRKGCVGKKSQQIRLHHAFRGLARSALARAICFDRVDDG